MRSRTDEMKLTGAGGMKAISASRARADGWWEVGIGHESQPVFISSRTVLLRLLAPFMV